MAKLSVTSELIHHIDTDKKERLCRMYTRRLKTEEAHPSIRPDMYFLQERNLFLN